MNMWEILEIEATKDVKQIKSAYAKMVKKYHPEEFPNEFKNLQKAYKQALNYAKQEEKPPEIIPDYDTFMEESFWIHHYSEQKKQNNQEVIEEPKETYQQNMILPKIHYQSMENFAFLEQNKMNPTFWAFENYVYVYMKNPFVRENILNWTFLFEYEPFNQYISKEIYWYPLIENMIEYEVIDAQIGGLIHFYTDQMQLVEEFVIYLEKFIPKNVQTIKQYKKWRESTQIEDDFAYLMAQNYVQKEMDLFHTFPKIPTLFAKECNLDMMEGKKQEQKKRHFLRFLEDKKWIKKIVQRSISIICIMLVLLLVLQGLL